VVAVLSCLVLTACNPEQLGPKAGDWTMAVAPSAYATREDTQELLQNIKDRTEGQLIIEQCSCRELLIPDSEVLSYLGVGLVEIAAASCDTDGATWMRFHTFPYFLDNPDIGMYKAFAEAQYPMIAQIYQQKGVKVITPQGMPSNPSRLLLVTKKPVRTLEDLRGMTISIDTPEQTAMLNKLGVVTTNLPIAEVYWALWRNSIDGIIIEPQVAMNYSIDEVAHYSVGLWPSMTLSYYGIEQTAFENLPEDFQLVLLECFEEYSNKSWESVSAGKAEEKWKALIEENRLSYLKSFPPEEEARLIRIARTCWRAEIEQAGPEGQQWLEIYEMVSGNKIPD